MSEGVKPVPPKTPVGVPALKDPGDPAKAGGPAKKEGGKAAKAGPSVNQLKYLAWRWERITVWPMLILSILFVTLQLIWLFHRHSLSESDRSMVVGTILFLWALFALDFMTRFLVNTDKKSFIKSRWMELAALIMPLLRPILPVYYLWRTPFFIKASPKAIRLRYQVTVTVSAVFLVYLIASLVYLAESSAPKANIKTWGDGLWWAVVTVTTVGYGDYIPVTVVGRLLGIVLMVTGLMLVGIISASVVSYIADGIKSATVSHAKKDRETWVKMHSMGKEVHSGTEKDWSFDQGERNRGRTKPSTPESET